MDGEWRCCEISKWRTRQEKRIETRSSFDPKKGVEITYISLFGMMLEPAQIHQEQNRSGFWPKMRGRRGGDAAAAERSHGHWWRGKDRGGGTRFYIQCFKTSNICVFSSWAGQQDSFIAFGSSWICFDPDYQGCFIEYYCLRRIFDQQDGGFYFVIDPEWQSSQFSAIKVSEKVEEEATVDFQ